MAGKKITELPELGATPAAGDWLVVVDVSDTSESPEGTTKKVLKSDAIPTSGGGVESVTGELVDNTDPINPIVKRPYLNWVGKVSQSGTSAPTITYEFENNLGTSISFIRNGVGSYSIQPSADLFTESNTFALITNGASTYNDCFVVITGVLSNKINFLNYGNGGGLQDVFTNMNIEIRIYT